MGDVEDYDFSVGDAGASHTYPNEAGQIRVGGYMMIKGHPCKVSHVSTSKTGKHGSAKCNFTAIDIFTGKKYEDIIPSTAATDIPVVQRKEYSLMEISDDEFCSLMYEDGTVREDIKLPSYPDNFGREIKMAFESGKSLMVCVFSACGIDQITSYKEEAEGK
mmetsp:Transcript_30653/g.31191  ORF Transcript_30653/g.31191 Transcript_30653/m.31191 type:complete len:162 (-) Transcript_30653:124-609(-)|eukprot:CAMPEP_0182421784 /NCGR_PEP_ID=MMETSP1167-20130531/7278_1 /TAXON_ID=2988 /ORGANISM="Mallomonas Sp, Strain CCMP3275" /LENGTH=161 /DNA_ID=CAMNT_0024599259 /DNA_START=116 /DNA_END=601 /DNA_ORIENTATION=-